MKAIICSYCDRVWVRLRSPGGTIVCMSVHTLASRAVSRHLLMHAIVVSEAAPSSRRHLYGRYTTGRSVLHYCDVKDTKLDDRSTGYLGVLYLLWGIYKYTYSIGVYYRIPTTWDYTDMMAGTSLLLLLLLMSISASQQAAFSHLKTRTRRHLFAKEGLSSGTPNGKSKLL